MKYLRLYLIRHRRGFLLFGAFSAVFFFLFLLYRLPVEAVAYAAAVCAFIGLIVTGSWSSSGRISASPATTSLRRTGCLRRITRR